MFVYNKDVVNKTAKYGKAKGIFMIINGLSGCLFCILAGSIIIGIILAFLCVAVSILYYIRNAGYHGLSEEDYIFSAPLHPYPLIASYVIAIALSLITGGVAGKLGELWLAIVLVFVPLLLLQIWLWVETVNHAVNDIENERKTEILSDFTERIRKGDIKCGMCRRMITDFYSVAIEDGKAVVLCDNCLPWKGKGRHTVFQGMTFEHKRIRNL